MKLSSRQLTENRLRAERHCTAALASLRDLIALLNPDLNPDQLDAEFDIVVENVSQQLYWPAK